jgi:hypothetical protein
MNVILNVLGLVRFYVPEKFCQLVGLHTPVSMDLELWALSKRFVQHSKVKIIAGAKDDGIDISD